MFKQRVAIDGGEYPRLVSVETTSRCNAECPFCPYNVKQRDKKNMDEDLFLKIIDDCRAFPLETIEPFMNGEPFVDPRIIHRLEHIRRTLPRTKLSLYTNGYGFSPKRIDEVIALGGVDKLIVSLNTLDPVRYQAIMGFKLDRTLDNMKYLTDPARRSKVSQNISFRMTRMDDSTLEEQDKFIAYCRERGVRPFLVGLFNYKGDIPSHLPVPSYGCEHMERVDILSDGQVTLCCMDHEGEYTWGDVRTHSVLEVFRSQVAARYRQMHRTGRRREIEPCDKCNLFWPGTDNMSPWQTVRTVVGTGLYFIRHRPIGRKAPIAPPSIGQPAPEQLVPLGRTPEG
jgi:radical SAM protein with 4Fe4S-binding SPASM domain